MSLRGSRSSIVRQNSYARANRYTFLRTTAQVLAAVAVGQLTLLAGNEDYRLVGASFPFARPEVRLFVERLAAGHRAACGRQLVVTSLTRPVLRQPPNASPLSIHPAGMALDLRVSRPATCRRWLENTLLSLEATGVVDATRERSPPHYHVAVFPRPYALHVAQLLARDSARKAERDRARRVVFSTSTTLAVRRANALTANFGSWASDDEAPVHHWLEPLIGLFVVSSVVALGMVTVAAPFVKHHVPLRSAVRRRRH